MKNYHHLFLLLAAMLLVQTAYGQVTNNVELPTSINNTGNAPNSSAILDVQSTTQGMLVPRMTSAQRTAISSPANGLLVFDTSMGGFWFYNGLSWLSLSGGGSSHWQADTFNGGINYTDRIAVNHVETDSNAELYVYKTNTGAGESGIFARRQSSFTAFDGGSSWSDTGIDAAIKGFSQTGNTYSTAIYGSSYLDFNRSASVVGAHSNGSSYGALGYKDANGDILAGYFEGDVNVNGRAVVNGSINDDADLYIEQSEYGAIKSGLYVRNTAVSGINGTGWMPSGVCSAIRAYSNTGNSYSTSVYGGSPLIHNNSASILGTHAGGATYGALGFRDGNGDLYAGYFEGDVNISSRVAINSGSVNADADLHITQSEYGEGKSAIKAYRGASLNAGTSWGVDDVDGVIHSTSYAGEQYNTALYGANDLTNAHNAGVVGYEIGGAAYGALAYRDELNGIYAGYFQGDVNVNGALTMDDGTQAAGRVLTSDANGTASWQDAPSDGHWLEDANGIYRTDGNVGIGTEGTPPNSALHVNQWNTGPGMSGLAVHRDPLTSGGTDWSDSGVDAAIKGTSLSGSSFSAAIYGSNTFNANWTAGVMGANDDGTIYGALGYYNPLFNRTYAGHFTGDVAIFSNDNTQNSVALLATRSSPGAGNASIAATRYGFANNLGGATDWNSINHDCALIAHSDIGNSYSTSIYATSPLGYDNSAVVYATDGNGTDAFLGYKDGSGDLYAGYFKGSLRIKQNESFNGISFERQNSADYWQLGIGTISQSLFFYYNGTQMAYISQSDGAYHQTSDRSLKTNIEYLGGVLPKVMQLKPAKYNYKSSLDAPQKSHGFIAQEVQEIFPEIVRETEEGTLALAYDDFAILAVQAIKEQQEIIDGQQVEIDKLKIEQEKNAELEKSFNEMKAELATIKAMLTDK